MVTYTNSKGEAVDVSTMPDAYLAHALAKALSTGNTANAQALQVEQDKRKELTK